MTRSHLYTAMAVCCISTPTLTSCHEERQVHLTGVVHDAPIDGEPLAAVEILSRDSTLEVFSETTAADDGSFRLPLNAAQDFFLELYGADLTRTLFAGEAGVFDMELADGALWAHPAGYVETVSALFCGEEEVCIEAGRVIEGEVRLWLPADDSAAAPLVENAWVTAWSTEGEPYQARYLGEEGEPDPEAVVTGPMGRFAIFDPPTGPLLLEVSYGPAPPSEPGEIMEDAGYWYYKVNMVEDAAAPFWPAFVSVL